MATFTFETMTQAQASAFGGNDLLNFSSGSTTALNLAVSQSGDATTLSAGGVSLAFSALQLYIASVDQRVSFVDGSSILFGRPETDRLTGSGRSDVIYGFDGNDTLESGTGNDYVYGGGGSDLIIAGAGNHHLYGNALNAQQGAADGADTIEGSVGKDYIQGNAGDDVLRGLAGDDRIFGGSGADSVDAGDGADQINGNVGDDTVDGGDGNDVVRGGQGNDRVLGGTGDDNLYGDLGDDTLVGGVGIDVLFGGAGSDRFVFAAGDAPVTNLGTSGPQAGLVDIVADFTDGADRLGIDAVVTTVLRDTQGNGFSTIAGARVYAQALMNGSAVPNENEVVALAVGNDTALFWRSGPGTEINAVVKLLGVAPTAIGVEDFI